MTKKEITYGQLFLIFLKAGLALGGGLAVIFAMEQEIVQKHKFMSRGEFMSLFAVGRIVPSGTVTALAIGIGYRYRKIPGILVALFGVMLPGFTLTIFLAAFYTILKGSSFFDLINISILPAAVGLIFLSALSMGKDVFHSPLLIAFAAASFIATFFLNISVALVIIAGGILGIIIFSTVKGGHDLPY